MMAAGSTVFVVGDDAGVRSAIRTLAASSGLGVACHASAEEFLDAYDPSWAGCLVVDARLPGMGGVELLERLAERGHRIPAIVVSADSEVQTAIRAMKAGAMDVIEKPFDEGVLGDRICRAVDRDFEARRRRVHRDAVVARWEELTPRERQVMEHVVAGLANKQIAAKLGISIKTVEVHRAHLMRKMGASSLVDLVRMVMQAAEFGVDR